MFHFLRGEGIVYLILIIVSASLQEPQRVKLDWGQRSTPAVVMLSVPVQTEASGARASDGASAFSADERSHFLLGPRPPPALTESDQLCPPCCFRSAPSWETTMNANEETDAQKP